MEGLNGHFSGWKRPSHWGPPGIDTRTGFILCHGRWAEEGSKQWALQYFTSFSEDPELFWVLKWWLNSKRTSKLSKQGENVATKLQRKQTWGKITSSLITWCLSWNWWLQFGSHWPFSQTVLSIMQQQPQFPPNTGQHPQQGHWEQGKVSHFAGIKEDCESTF